MNYKKLFYLSILIFSLEIKKSDAQNVKYFESIHAADSLLRINKNNEAAKMYDSAFRSYKKKYIQNDVYNAACAYARIGDTDNSFYYLQILVKNTNYANRKEISEDNDLIKLHDKSAWAPLIQEVEENEKSANSKFNHALKDTLELIFDKDQFYRRKLMEAEGKNEGDPLIIKKIEDSIAAADERNVKIVEGILNKYGWVGTDYVGEKGASAVFAVIQHADNYPELQKKAVPLLRVAVNKGVAHGDWLALLEDRILVSEGKPQLYGTQLHRGPDGLWKPFPMSDPENVDTRRAEVGLFPLKYYLGLFNKQASK